MSAEMKVSADIQPGFILNPLVRYVRANPALIPDKPFLNNATDDVYFARNPMRIVYTDKSSGKEKTDLSRDRLITAPHLLFLNIR